MNDPAWALTPQGLARVLAELDARERLVECGSGASTLAIAASLRDRGHGHLHSVEHDPGWAENTRAAIEDQDLGGWVDLLEAPLDASGWYDRAAVERLPSPIDLLLVDGPPGGLREDGETRYAALPALAPKLAAGALIILDDIHRPGERRVVERWRSEFGIDFALQAEERLAIGVFSGV